MNLKHLRYFWAVAHAGSVAAASNQLHLTPQTVSAQIKLLEDDLGTALFKPAGRGLELTEAGRVALSYADEIFALGHEMVSSLRANAIPEQTMATFRVGISDAIPKSLTHRLLASLKRVEKPIRLVCHEGTIDWLLGELALHRLEMVLADRPMPAGLAVRGHSRKLGESAVAFFAAPELARRGAAFPACLNGAPLLLPGQNAAVRGEIDLWLGESRLYPRVIGEFDDSALMKVFAQAGEGYFPAPAILSDEICARYGVSEVGRLEEVREAFWLISTERRIQHPEVRAVLEAARGAVFVPQGDGQMAR
ncbi:MAG: transcriptional activator NhaR [Gammaproteobacteria bacterium]|jgi:LysR family transcriptional regulator, transcriptional activator of nhaA|uniref:Transcriptional activator NhaR n=3 Tax=Pseudomonadota TaxID=1224 RepID=A0A4R5U162_9GAMM|nr:MULTISPECIES: transcriptional activator NhaR [Pseudomonadota]PKM00998.1 MAG: transcriptional activator NhaR [Gammaproteobacteria bacterium HGW-Gammaproteobacteria-9]ARP93446.1 transcriptional activator NhaR [Bordetella genomosp. 13]KJS66048.2 MAG: LysR family transcriptional regulator [[Pseudomonas] sp. BICA1-14]TDK27297.1 transcriptional activator NhaR [Luteimonas aestuarii]GGK12741.1 transcriptional activator NhaR [Luteimonas terricola]|tara:strand:- start:3451 stop:4371 length:921 start_codon:yes stop_codon:yes gene_type:complete